jgi:hypothetical protein
LQRRAKAQIEFDLHLQTQYFTTFFLGEEVENRGGRCNMNKSGASGSASGVAMLAEERLLISLLRVAEGTDSRLQETSAAIDWERFLHIAEFHGVSGIAWSALRRGVGVAALPLWVQNRLRELYYGNCAVYTLAIESLRTLSEQFLSHGVHFLVVKGVPLLGGVYEDIGTRPLNDIDILIKREDLFAVDSILREDRYEREEHSPRVYVKGEEEVVELHTRLTDLVTPVRLSEKYVPTSLTDEVIWRKRVTADVLGFPLATLSEDHTFALSLLHMAYKHEFERFIWCVDFVRLLERVVGNEGWRGIIRIAKETGTSSLMSDALLYSSLALGLRVPESAYLRLGRPLLHKRLIFALHSGTLTGLARHTYSLLRTRTLAGKVRFLLRAITPSKRVLSEQSWKRRAGLLSYIRHCYRIAREMLNLMTVIVGVRAQGKMRETRTNLPGSGQDSAVIKRRFPGQI